MTNKFKVGDKVRLITADTGDNIVGLANGDTGIVIAENGESHVDVKFKKLSYERCMRNTQLEKIDFTKDDLQNGDVVTLRNGDKLVYVRDRDFEDLTTDYANELTGIYELTDNLEYEYCDVRNKDYDIIKVERPTYTTVFERDEEVKEMTIAEISKALGYEVKIVKEEER